MNFFWNKFYKKSRTYGFTLIELLIVLAIVTFLTSVFFPTMMEARAKAEDGRRMTSAKSLQTEIANQTNVGSLGYASIFTIGETANKLNKLVADAGLLPGTYSKYSDATSFVLVLPMKTNPAKYWCVDAEGNAKNVPGLLITSTSGPKNCDNATGPVLSIGGSSTSPYTTTSASPTIIVSTNIGDVVTIPGYTCSPSPATGTSVTCTTTTTLASGNQTVTITTNLSTGGSSISSVLFTVDVATVPTVSIAGTTGASPIGLVLDSSGNIYTANTGSNNVTKITPSGVSTTFATTGSMPSSITIDTSGNLYVANAGSNNVTKITPSGVSTILGTTGNNPEDIVVDSSGNVYTANENSNNVTKITPAGVSSILGTTGSQPGGIVIDSSGNIFTHNKYSKTITKITPSGVSTTFATYATAGVPSMGMIGLIIDNSNNLYVPDEVNNKIWKITSSGIVSLFGSTDVVPWSIAMDSTGAIFSGNLGPSNITKITSTGTSTTSFASVDPFPTDMKISSSGVIYVVNSDMDAVTKIIP